jgi:hypothetical protein
LVREIRDTTAKSRDYNAPKSGERAISSRFDLAKGGGVAGLRPQPAAQQARKDSPRHVNLDIACIVVYIYISFFTEKFEEPLKLKTNGILIAVVAYTHSLSRPPLEPPFAATKS